MRCSIEPRERRYVEGYGFLSFARNLIINMVKNFLILLKNLQQMHLKFLVKEQFKKPLKQQKI